MQNWHELSKFKLSLSRDSLTGALIGNVSILYLSINLSCSNLLENKQLKIGMNFADNPIQYLGSVLTVDWEGDNENRTRIRIAKDALKS